MAMRSLHFPELTKRLLGKQVVQLACEGRNSIRLVYAVEDGSIYQLLVDTLSKNEAAEWIDALEQAGLDPTLVAGGRKELVTRHSAADGKLGGTEAAGGGLSFELQPALDTWNVSGFVSR
jgi:hypothetical protein